MYFYVQEFDLRKLPRGTTIEKRKLTFLDYRTVPNLEEAKKHFWYKDWFEKGTNHREDPKQNMVVCDVPALEFTIELNTLETLLLLLIEAKEELSITLAPYLEAPFQIAFNYRD